MMGSDNPALTNLDAYEWQGMQAQACDAGGFANRCPILFYVDPRQARAGSRGEIRNVVVNVAQRRQGGFIQRTQCSLRCFVAIDGFVQIPPSKSISDHRQRLIAPRPVNKSQRIILALCR
jgi:hypothetical protein